MNNFLLITDKSATGRIALWGAGAKGVAFLNLIDPNRRLIDCVVDINPQKQGKYIPGTGHMIVSPQELTPQYKKVFLTNSNYEREVLHFIGSKNIAIIAIDRLSMAISNGSV